MNKVALITGGSRGIGFGVAERLARVGFDLAINGVRDENDDNVIDALMDLRSYGTKIIYCQGDISNTQDRKSIVDSVKGSFGRLNVLVNNAGVAPFKRCDFLEVTEENYDRLMAINQKGTFFISQMVSKWMVKQVDKDKKFEGFIVNITSISALAASIQRAEYCMSKASLSMLSKVMAIRMAEVGIPVYEIQPGFIDTDMITKVREKYVGLSSSDLLLEKRLGTPDDIGRIVASLVTGNMPYSTGQIIAPDGGLGLFRF